MEKSGEALKGAQEKEDRHDGARPKVVVQKPSKSRRKAKIDPPKAKGFASLPRHLQELVLLKTSTQTRLWLFQVNLRLREWVFKEGLFSRDVQRVETAYRPKRPQGFFDGVHFGGPMVHFDGVPIFKVFPRSHLTDIVEIDMTKAKKWIAFKNVRSCRDLVAHSHWRVNHFRIADSFPNLRALGTFDLGYLGFDLAFFEALFEGTSCKVTSACRVPNEFLTPYHAGKLDKERLFRWIDKYTIQCPSINFAEMPIEMTVKFLETQKLRFIEYSMHSVRDDREFVEMILKNGIPGKHPDPCIKIMVGPGFMVQVMSTLTKNGTLVIGDLEWIRKKFMDHRAEVGWHFDSSSVILSAVGFTSRIDESKNMIVLWSENDAGVAELLIKYEPIEK